MTKEEEVLSFLHDRVFDPVLRSGRASAELKAGVRQTILRMGRLPAQSIVQFFWTAISGTDRSVDFARMRQEGFARFEEVAAEFRERFDDDWLRDE